MLSWKLSPETLHSRACQVVKEWDQAVSSGWEDHWKARTANLKDAEGKKAASLAKSQPLIRQFTAKSYWRFRGIMGILDLMMLDVETVT